MHTCTPSTRRPQRNSSVPCTSVCAFPFRLEMYFADGSASVGRRPRWSGLRGSAAHSPYSRPAKGALRRLPVCADVQVVKGEGLHRRRFCTERSGTFVSCGTTVQPRQLWALLWGVGVSVTRQVGTDFTRTRTCRCTSATDTHVYTHT